MKSTSSKTFWVIELDEIESWASDATEIDAYRAEDAAKEFAEDWCGLDDDGDSVEIVVADNAEGVGAVVYDVTCEVVREYDAWSQGPVVVPSAAGADDAEKPPVDTLTLDLFGSITVSETE